MEGAKQPPPSTTTGVRWGPPMNARMNTDAESQSPLLFSAGGEVPLPRQLVAGFLIKTELLGSNSGLPVGQAEPLA